MSSHVFLNKTVNNNNVKLVFFLTKIYGLGYLSSKLICKTLGYDINTKINELQKKDWDKLYSIIKIKYMFLLDNDVKKVIYDNIEKMKNMKCYKGIRHSYNLPVNSRRTKTNAKTRGWR